MKSVIWSDKEKEIAKTMCLEGYTAQSISERLKRSRNSVIGFLHRSGMTLAKAKRFYKKRTKPVVIPEINSKPVGVFVKFSVKLMNARYRQCRFIQDIANNPADTMICGAKTSENSSWCPDHHSLVYRKVTNG